jgi:putative oxidoreductase
MSDMDTDRSARYSLDGGLLCLRVGYAALLFGYHGANRLAQVYAYVAQGQPWPFVSVVEKLGFPAPALFALASALSEAIGAILIALGVASRWAAAMVSISMAVAVSSKVMKSESYELPGLYLLGAVAISALGPGRFALEGIRSRLSERKRDASSAAAIASGQTRTRTTSAS